MEPDPHTYNCRYFAIFGPNSLFCKYLQQDRQESNRKKGFKCCQAEFVQVLEHLKNPVPYFQGCTVSLLTLETARVCVARWGTGKLVAAKLSERDICVTTETPESNGDTSVSLQSCFSQLVKWMGRNRGWEIQKQCQRQTDECSWCTFSSREILSKISHSSEQQPSCRKSLPARPLCSAGNSRVFDEVSETSIWFYVQGSMFSLYSLFRAVF